ncbi:hydrogenase maturation nickel metallochaperone HypA, partial [Pseudonocardia hydrocarbonoxydans]|uniref:hydrogenase maturation nickel metallochaperone HypA n=1 Tax=Pseudonocardia hydrocarbonoxydans TaxID=76726 RepID=UPI001C3FAB4F
MIRVQTRDAARAERTRERAAEARRREIDMRVTWSANDEDVPEPLPTRGTIFAWSPKSRARMVARLSDLDYNRLYGRYRICSDCGTDYPDHRFTCPDCHSPK